MDGSKRNLICAKGFDEAVIKGTLEDTESTTFRFEVQLCEEPKATQAALDLDVPKPTCQTAAKA